MFHSITLYEMLSVTSSRSLCFTALLCMKCCQWLPADRYVSQRYSVQSNAVKHNDLLEVTDNISYRVTLWNITIFWGSLTTLQIVMSHSVTLYEMLSVTSSRSLCFTALLWMKCCQWLPADHYVSQLYSLWNVVSDFQQIIMFHSVTLYEMLSVTSSRSLCFTALLCMKCCQWLPADRYVWNITIFWKSLTTFHTE
jgi:hypothetical protein